MSKKVHSSISTDSGYFLGIDGGASGSVILAIDSEGNELFRGYGGPINPFSVGAEPSVESIRNVISDLSAIGGVEHCRAACLGAAGFHEDADGLAARAVLQELLPHVPILITNDYETALFGATGRPEGVIVIAGTGSVAVGRDLSSRLIRAGGWGHLLGDEGSAFYIGREALIAIFKARDEMGPPSSLSRRFLEHTESRDYAALMRWAYQPSGKRSIARLAPLVQEAALEGDAVALDIEKRAAHELVTLVATLWQRLRFQGQRVPLVPLGGVLCNNEHIRSLFEREVCERFPRALVSKPVQDAAYGAALIARNEGRRGI